MSLGILVGVRFDGDWLPRTLLLVAAAGITWFWWTGTPQAAGATPGLALIAVAELLGLLAALLVAAQLLLIARVPWLVRTAGAGRLVGRHVTLGATTTLLVATHVVAMVAGGALVDGGTPWAELATQLERIDHLPLALAGTVLMLLVGLSCAGPLRRRLPRRAWYLLHLAIYPAVILASFHQLAAGTHLVGSPWARVVWFVVYGAVAAALLRWRVGPALVGRLRTAARPAEAAEPELVAAEGSVRA